MNYYFFDKYKSIDDIELTQNEIEELLKYVEPKVDEDEFDSLDDIDFSNDDIEI